MRRVVRALLFLFPARFREMFGHEMLTTFEDRWRERHGWRVGLRTVLDLLAAAALERARKPKGDGLMTILIQDLRFAARTLLRSPGFTLVALATLALGIGVNTAMFSVAHGVLWSSLPYPHPERLMMVGEVNAKKPDEYWGSSYPNFLDWKARSTSFEHLAAIVSDETVLREGTEPARVSGLLVSHDFFDAMGVNAAIGRVFGAAEDKKGAAPAIVLSHRMWTARFAGNPAIIGRAIRFEESSPTVIGVMPPGFKFQNAEFWTPLEPALDDYFRTGRSVWVLKVIGRLRDGQTETRAQGEVEGIAAQIRRQFPETRRGLVVRVSAMRDELSRDLRPALLVLLGAVALVLLIACGNLAGLMLVRGNGRAREVAIRGALGVSGPRLVRQLLTESALLALLGGSAGVLLALWSTRAIGLLTKDPRLLEVKIDPSVLLFAAAATVVTTILFGIAPAIRATRIDLTDALKSGSRSNLSRKQGLAQRVLVVAEVALCLVLLAGAGLLFKSFRHVLDVQPGFQTANLVTMRVELPGSYDKVAAVNGFYERVLSRISDSTLVNRLPITGLEPNGDINIEGRPTEAGELGAATFRRIMPNYFRVMGIPLVKGRVFDARDDGSRGRVVIINEGFARRFWPHEDPIGKRVSIGPKNHVSWTTIVGVVGDVRQLGLDSEAPFSTYEPLIAQPQAGFEIAARTGGDPQSAVAQVRRELREVEPGVVIDRVATMSQRIEESVSPRRLNLVLFGLFAGLALVLAAVGLYGVVAYAASQRTQEFGIRMALGAGSGDVMRLVLGQGLTLASAGVILGIAATLGLGRWLASLLFGVGPADPWTLTGVAVMLTIVAIAACWLPAYRATRISPVEALRGA